ncbi:MULTISPECIES: thiol:disulfide interchange protein TlpA [Ochrobactrum]|jgi:thiol-disulfide isomerase/thioredoxin|uniref:Disulfide interchange protein TlpA n=1 Tax=Ochrobactrum quorumnocens TaxID=271865 RepID=A0A248UJ30_9HYPH|nr:MULTISPECIES: TlpA disulfide reductase family protein [Brucella/Ochrobactrum group]ASV86853.1 disulfide interchange protein TlpA [[Ochrobactrum] quorumnocens]MBD7991057.1 TlpA family protein disulfide reductase [Ochrobactrum gallinarum]MCV9906006.1 TlpA family protein disulfide reductase [Brucella sp. HL-2]MDH7790429.1 thiol-disulfide isomerase/thioredoxin [Ochrobactrum sp. AN78]
MAENNDKAKPGNRKIVLLAALAGVIAGIGAVYVMERPSGNASDSNVSAASSVSAQSDEASAQCALKADSLKSLDAAATGSVAAMRAAEKPISVAHIAFTGPDGKQMTLGDYKGKTLLVNLWATWCAPCREEMPELDNLQAAKGGSDFDVVAINIDTGSDEKPKKFLEEIGIKSLSLNRDATMSSFNELKRKNLAFGLPVTLLVDKEGCQIASMNGPAPWDSPDAIKLIEAAQKL